MNEHDMTYFIQEREFLSKKTHSNTQLQMENDINKC